jgi:SAM-dependent methyltransferase
MEGKMFQVYTDHPVATDSPDHTHPLGTANDNSRNPEFNGCLRWYGWARLGRLRLKVMDVGCAGGGLVSDLIADEHDAIGVEGSDYSLTRGRAEWPRLGGSHLFTADVRHPFAVSHGGRHWTADVITAWEFFEHIDEPSLAGVVGNLRRHLARPLGIIVASIATFPDPPRHVTVRDREWWLDRFGALGFVHDEFTAGYFAPHWVRDQGPGRGFHVVLRRAD